MGAFMSRNGKDKRFPEMEALAKELKGKFKKVGAIGYCYGGWAVLQLGAKGKGLVDAISTAHPSALTKEEIEGVGVPVQILCEFKRRKRNGLVVTDYDELQHRNTTTTTRLS